MEQEREALRVKLLTAVSEVLEEFHKRMGHGCLVSDLEFPFTRVDSLANPPRYQIGFPRIKLVTGNSVIEERQNDC